VIKCRITDDVEELAERLHRPPDLVLVDIEATGHEKFCSLVQNERLRKSLTDSRILFMIQGGMEDAENPDSG